MKITLDYLRKCLLLKVLAEEKVKLHFVQNPLDESYYIWRKQERQELILEIKGSLFEADKYILLNRGDMEAIAGDLPVNEHGEVKITEEQLAAFAWEFAFGATANEVSVVNYAA
ncbi:hypothetical protein FACS1894217_12070 [Clostridia bacterium]|nr:hypothetical protein FACS1894217_12070 [Clostridia bacterium]